MLDRARIARLLVQEGAQFSYETIGNKLGVSKQRILQVIEKSPILQKAMAERRKLKAGKREVKRQVARHRYFLMHGHHREDKADARRLGQRQRQILTRLKHNNDQHYKYDYDLRMDSIEFPTHCPVLGIELNYFSKVKCDNSPSFDRLDPKGGYVEGNVVVISNKANAMKYTANSAEVLKLYRWMKRRGL